MTDRYYLSKGKHENAADGRCAMEWVAHLAGEEHSDQPRCVSPVLKLFCISFNDALGDEKRQRLRPYLARTIGTAGDGHDPQRDWLATDWLIRTYTPTWLAFAGLDEAASQLRSLPPVLAQNLESQAMPELRSAKLEATAAWATAVRASTGSRCAGSSAATTLANNAASVATWDTARAAAKAVVWADARACSFSLLALSARTATAAARDAAAWTAAKHTATTAAWDAAAWAGLGAAASLAQVLKPTVDALQDSTFDLFDRMLPMEVIQLPVAADEFLANCTLA